MAPDLRSQIASAFATGVTAPPAPRPRWLRRGRVDLVFVADLVIALICFGATDGVLGTESANHGYQFGSGELLGVSFALCAPLVLRSRLPLTAWAASAAAIVWTTLVIQPRSLSPSSYLVTAVLVYGLCLYAVAVRCKAWVVLAAVLCTVAGASLIDAPTALSAVFLTAIPVLAGVIVRSRRSNREQLAVVERRHEGERALLEERQRIARELHDVVAHHMSVIAIQAEAAPYKTADPPQELVDSFVQIRAAALSGLGELRRVLGVLRSETADTAPTPGLDDLDSLLESARNGGVRVTCSVTGTPRPLPDGVDLSAYRIVQEALSNAIRHAPGATVQVRLYYGEAALIIEVRNSRGAAGAGSARTRNDALSRGGGHGIIGMRERAAMLGGHLSAGPAMQDEFLVTAALPLDGEGAEAPHQQDEDLAIRVVVADDQGMVRSGFSVLLNAQPDIDVVGEAVNGREAVAHAAGLHPDVILMDVRMPVLDGLQATRQITAMPDPPKVLVLTTFDLDDYVYEALRSGASGFLLKDASARELADAVRLVAAGDALLAPGVTRRLIAEFARLGAPRSAGRIQLEGLTERESEVLALVARGLSNAEIADRLFVAEQTVKTHVSRILMKLGLRDRTQAVVLAYETGLVHPGG